MRRGLTPPPHHRHTPTRPTKRDGELWLRDIPPEGRGFWIPFISEFNSRER